MKKLSVLGAVVFFLMFYVESGSGQDEKREGETKGNIASGQIKDSLVKEYRAICIEWFRITGTHYKSLNCEERMSEQKKELAENFAKKDRPKLAGE